MSTLLKCDVCGQAESAPVSGDWHFRANDFLLEAYREHGVEAIVWTLWILWSRAQRSFYFAPSMWLWETYPLRKEDGPTVEIDALAVVDGKLYLCEAKSSAALKLVSNRTATQCSDAHSSRCALSLQHGHANIQFNSNYHRASKTTWR